MYNGRRIDGLVRQQGEINSWHQAQVAILAQQQAQINAQLIARLTALEAQVNEVSNLALEQAKVVLLLKQQIQTLNPSHSSTSAKPELQSENATKAATNEVKKALIEYFDEYSQKLSDEMKSTLKENEFLSLQKQVLGFERLFIELAQSRNIQEMPDIEGKSTELKNGFKQVFQRYLETVITEVIDRLKAININADLKSIKLLEGRYTHLKDQCDLYFEKYGEIGIDQAQLQEAYNAFSEVKNIVESRHPQPKPLNSKKQDKAKPKEYSSQLIRALQAATVAGCLSSLANTSLRYMYGSEKVPLLAKVVSAILIVGAVCFAGFSGNEANSR